MARRTATVTLPLFQVERQAVIEAAEEAGVSMTEFARAWLREGTRLRTLPFLKNRSHQPAEVRETDQN